MLHSKPRIGFSSALVFVLVLTACGDFTSPGLPVEPSAPELTARLEASPSPGTARLDGTEWTLRALGGQSLIEGTNITLNFADGQANGFAGCNAYGGTYTATDDGGLTISEMAITAQGCLEPEGVMEQEEAYMEALGDVSAYRIKNDNLDIVNDAGQLLLVFARKQELEMDPGDLVGTWWLLVSMNGSSPVEGSTITLVFDDEVQARGHAGCRDYAATYEADGDNLRFTFLSMHGDDSCLDREALALQEGDYTTMLEWVTNYQLGKGQLELLTARGETLVFTAEATGSSPTMTPEKRDCAGPNAFPTEEAIMNWPILQQAQPGQVAPGAEVRIIGTGGYLTWNNECGTMWNESARSFQIFFDDTPIGSITCYVNHCETDLTIPSDAIAGIHTLSVEGGSSISIQVGDN